MSFTIISLATKLLQRQARAPFDRLRNPNTGDNSPVFAGMLRAEFNF